MSTGWTLPFAALAIVAGSARQVGLTQLPSNRTPSSTSIARFLVTSGVASPCRAAASWSYLIRLSGPQKHHVQRAHPGAAEAAKLKTGCHHTVAGHLRSVGVAPESLPYSPW